MKGNAVGNPWAGAVGVTDRLGRRMIGSLKRWVGRGTVLGLHQGLDGLCLVEVSDRRGVVRVERQAWSLNACDDERALALARAVERGGWAGCPVRLALPTLGAMLRRQFVATDLPDEELALQTHAEACAAMPWAADDLVSDFCRIPVEEGECRAEILTAATRRDRIEALCRWAEAAGLQPVAAELDAHAAWRAAVAWPPGPGPQGVHPPLALAEWHHCRLRLRVFNGLELHFEREQVLAESEAAAGGGIVEELSRWLQHFQVAAVRVRLSELVVWGPCWDESHRAALGQAAALPIRDLNARLVDSSVGGPADGLLEAMGLGLGSGSSPASQGPFLAPALNFLPHRREVLEGVRRRWMASVASAAVVPIVLVQGLWPLLTATGGAGWGAGGGAGGESEHGSGSGPRGATHHGEAESAALARAEAEAEVEPTRKARDLEDRHRLQVLQAVQGRTRLTVEGLSALADPAAAGPGVGLISLHQLEANALNPRPTELRLKLTGQADDVAKALDYAQRLRAQGWRVETLAWTRADASQPLDLEGVRFELTIQASNLTGARAP